MNSRWLLPAGICFSVGVVLSGADGPPTWAYPSTPTGFAHAKDGAKHRLPESAREYTTEQIGDLFHPPDWYPRDHAVMPDPVGQGRRPDVRACASCHLPNGRGFPQSAALAGLPAEYIAAQLKDFALGYRLPAVGNANSDMSAIARAMTPGEIEAASRYFARLKVVPWIKVVEAPMSPTTTIVANDLVVPEDSAALEPIGERIVEVPETPVRARLFDSHVGFIAYVPPGSLGRGRNLVRTGGASVVSGKKVDGKTKECSTCHGLNLRGMAAKPDGTPLAPSIVGRSPTYTFRQLYDMKRGARKGANIATTMRSVVVALTEQDMIDIAAYLASRIP